jgi:hypothetical protein
MIKAKKELIYCIFLVIVALLPVISTFQFVELAIDDYCRANLPIETYFQRVYTWYLTHNGRYTNAIIASLPIYNSFSLKFSLLLLFLSLIGSIHFFLKALFKKMNIIIEKNSIWFVTTVLLILVVISLSSLFDFLYWFASATVYQLSITLFLLCTGIVLHLNTYKQLLVVSILVILLIGVSELLLIFASFLLVSYHLFLILSKKKINGKLLILQMIMLCASLIVLLAPGSKSRHAGFKSGGKFLYSLYHSFEESLLLLFSWGSSFSKLMILVILLLLSVFIVKFKKMPAKFKSVSPFLLLLISFCGLMSIIFIPFYASGFFVEQQGRVGNLINVITFFLLFVNILNFTAYVHPYLIKLSIHKMSKIWIIALLLILTMFSTKNYKYLYDDIFNHTFEKQELAHEHRLQTILNNSSSTDILELHFIEGSKTIPETLNREMKEQWFKECYLHYLNTTFNTHYRELKVIEN